MGKETQDKKEGAAKETKKADKGRIALVLLRGLIGVSEDKRRTLELLNLRNKHVCVVVDDTPVRTTSRGERSAKRQRSCSRASAARRIHGTPRS